MGVQGSGRWGKHQRMLGRKAQVLAMLVLSCLLCYDNWMVLVGKPDIFLPHLLVDATPAHLGWWHPGVVGNHAKKDGCFLDQVKGFAHSHKHLWFLLRCT